MKYAAIITSSFWVEGDERSKTNPGHGYPGHTETTISIKDFDSKETMLEYVERQENSKYGKDNYRLIEYSDLVVCKNISFTVK